MSAISGRFPGRARLRILVAAAILAGAVLLLLAGSSSAPASGRATVDINHFAFHPPTLHVARGTKVVFTNSAGIEHTATDRGAFDTGHIQPGHSVAVRFAQKGTFAYHCKIHPFMHGKIVVG